MSYITATRPQNLGERPAHVGAGHSAGAKLNELQSAQLFGNAQAVVIHHGGERYTLRRTSKGKLILTK